jgi:hypothetical protein
MDHLEKRILVIDKLDRFAESFLKNWQNKRTEKIKMLRQ